MVGMPHGPAGRQRQWSVPVLLDVEGLQWHQRRCPETSHHEPARRGDSGHDLVPIAVNGVGLIGHPELFHLADPDRRPDAQDSQKRMIGR